MRESDIIKSRITKKTWTSLCICYSVSFVMKDVLFTKRNTSRTQNRHRVLTFKHSCIATRSLKAQSEIYPPLIKCLGSVKFKIEGEKMPTTKVCDVIEIKIETNKRSASENNFMILLRKLNHSFWGWHTLNTNMSIFTFIVLFLSHWDNGLVSKQWSCFKWQYTTQKSSLLNRMFGILSNVN